MKRLLVLALAGSTLIALPSRGNAQPAAPASMASPGPNDPSVSPYYTMPSYPRPAYGYGGWGYGYAAPPSYFYPPAPVMPAPEPPQPPAAPAARSGVSVPLNAATFESDGPSASLAPGGAGKNGWAVGAGVYALKPFSARSPAFTTTTTTTNLAPGLQTNTQGVVTENGFDRGVQLAPILWAAYRTETNLGVRGRYWHFDQGTSRSTSNADGTGGTVVASDGTPPFQVTSPGTAAQAGVGPDNLRFDSQINLNVWDLEGFQGFGAGDWTLLLGGGARVVTLRQSYAAARTNPGGTAGGVLFTADEELLQIDSYFSGGGPLAVVEISRALSGGLHLFGTARGAVLFGQRNQRQASAATLNEVVNGGPLNTFTQQGTNGSEDRIIPFGELEVGLSYAGAVGGVQILVRSAVVGQVWQDAGSAVSRTGDLGFLGGLLELGLLY